MNAWVILLFFLLGNSNNSKADCGCSGRNDSCRGDRDCGCDRERGREREMECDCERGRDRGRERDCDDDSRFEPRFDARPFGGRDRETCGCEENNN